MSGNPADPLGAASGWVTIAGFGSLMQEASARETTPDLQNWRYGYVDGYARVFNLVSIINIRRGLATGQHLTTCTARPRKGCRLRVCLYDVPARQYPELLARERRLRESFVEFVEDKGRKGTACMFTEYSDAEYRAERATTDEMWQEEVGQFYSGSHIYRDDLLPVPHYLQRCLRAYAGIGQESLANFVDCSFLGDGTTSIRSYLEQNPEQWGDTKLIVGKPEAASV